MRFSWHRMEFLFLLMKYKIWDQWWHPAYKNQYTFTRDWFSWNIPIWKKYILEQLNQSNPLSVLEIGTYEGRSAFWLLENLLKKSSDRLICVDSDPESKCHFSRNFEKGNFSCRVEFLKGDSKNVLSDLKSESFDLVYVDGNHELDAVSADLKGSWEVLRSNGLLVVDDYLWREKHSGTYPVKEALDKFLSEPNHNWVKLFGDYQIIIQKK